MPETLYLVPPIFETGDLKSFEQSGQSLSVAVSPRSNALAVFAAPRNCIPKVQESRVAEEQDVYVATWDKAPASERRVFVTDTSVIFTACQQFKNVSQSEGRDLIRSPEVISTFRKLASDFIIHAKDCWVYSTQLMASSENPQYHGDHYKSLYTSLSLFQTLYLPEDGIEDVPVGDELLEWLNTHFIEPSSEEGDQLSALDRPWEDEIFWPYVVRATLRGLMKSAIFFLHSLANHPSDNLQRISGKLIDLLEKHPRQKHFSTEKEFFTMSRRWKDRVKVLRIELDRVPEDDRNDDYDNWWDNISDLLGILEGRTDVVQRVCDILGGGWKEIICTYGVWVDVGLRRADLPDLAEGIMTNLPPDPTDIEDALHAKLAQGQPSRALSIASQLDPWLAAHLSEIMVPLGLLNSGADDDHSGTAIRDHYIRAYAEYLYSDPGLWRLTVVYLFSCGEIGKRMADEVLLRVPLNLNDSQTAQGNTRSGLEESTMEIEDDVGEGDSDLAGIVKELNATCYEFQREQTRRMICRIASQKLISSRKYGLAISYCRSAEDWTMLGNIVDRVLEEYILHGPTTFVSLVVDIAPSLHELRANPGYHVVFVQRLMFAVRYAEFHQRAIIGDTENAALDLLSLFEENLAPRTWWGVLLHDSVDFVQNTDNLFLPAEGASLLLRRLEEITMRTRQGSGEDFLGVLARVLEISGPKDALRRLDVLRLALARYLARCTVSGPVSTGLSSHEF